MTPSRENGYATVTVLGIVLIISTVLIIFGLWVRWHAFTTTSFLERIEQKHLARDGISQGISLLLADSDPGADWLGEAWADGLSGDGVTVNIVDIGSRLGVNWMELDHWEKLLPKWVAHQVHEVIQTNEALVTFRKLREQYPSLVQLEAVLTEFSAFNINFVESSGLKKLIKASKMPSSAAEDLVQEIISLRVDDPLSIEEFLALSGLSSRMSADILWWITDEGPININTASREVLTLFLQSDSMVDEILSIRRDKALSSIEELKTVFGDQLVDTNGITFRSRFFRIVSNVDGYVIEAITARRWNNAERVWELEILSWTEIDNGK